tara:strand:- start:29 stop:262 length:234 start_codon:yes stop_codon:yes gene_type:complete
MIIKLRAFEGYKTILSENGIVDSRHHDFCRAMDELHRAFCQLDLTQQRVFCEGLGEQSLIDAIRQYARSNPLLNDDL